MRKQANFQLVIKTRERGNQRKLRGKPFNREPETRQSPNQHQNGLPLTNVGQWKQLNHHEIEKPKKGHNIFYSILSQPSYYTCFSAYLIHTNNNKTLCQSSQFCLLFSIIQNMFNLQKQTLKKSNKRVCLRKVGNVWQSQYKQQIGDQHTFPLLMCN